MPIADRRWRIALLVYCCVMAGLLLLPAPLEDVFPEAELGLDKLVHAVLFAGFAFVLFENLDAARRRAAVGAFFVAVAAAGLIEIIQAPLPYRAGEVLDFAAGTAGALVGASLAAVLGRRTGAGTAGRTRIR